MSLNCYNLNSQGSARAQKVPDCDTLSATASPEGPAPAMTNWTVPVSLLYIGRSFSEGSVEDDDVAAALSDFGGAGRSAAYVASRNELFAKVVLWFKRCLYFEF